MCQLCAFSIRIRHRSAEQQSSLMQWIREGYAIRIPSQQFEHYAALALLVVDCRRRF